jgi:hypothetical protein
MERRRDPLLREVVHLVTLSPRTWHFAISARRSQAEATSVTLTRRDPDSAGRQPVIQLSHAAAEQYLAADIWPSPAARRPRASGLWSYHPDAGRYTSRDIIPTVVRVWVETAL